jgi:hypothetical protein
MTMTFLSAMAAETSAAAATAANSASFASAKTKLSPFVPAQAGTQG